MSEEDGKLKLVVNATQLDLKLPVYSSTVTIQHVPWNLKLLSKRISHHKKDQVSEDIVLGLFVQCTPEVSDWSMYAQVTLRVKNHNSEKHIMKCYTRNYSTLSNDWGFSYFTKLKNILDPNMGFVKDGKVTFEAHVHVQSDVTEKSNSLPAMAGGFDTFLVCPSCEMDFEIEGGKMPMSLRCGHTFCLDCLKKSLPKSNDTVSIECSTCQQTQIGSTAGDLWFPNHSVVHIVSNIMSKSNFFCREHQRDKDYYCYDDDTLVCIYCAHSSKHAAHSCKHVEESRKNKQEVLRKINFSSSTSISDIDRRHEFMKDKIEMLKIQERNTLKTVNDSYDQLSVALQKQKDLLFKDVEAQTLILSGSLNDSASKLEEKQCQVKEILAEYSSWQNLPTKEALERFGEIQSSLSSLSALCDCSDLPQKLDSSPKLDFEVPSPTKVFNYSRFGNIVMRKRISSGGSQDSDTETQDYEDSRPKKRKTLAA